MALPYTYCTRIGLGFLAEACGKRGPASNTATDARAIGDDVAEFSGGRPCRAGLVVGRSMLSINGCPFRLGALGPTYDLATAHDHGPEAPRVRPLTHTKPPDREAMRPDPCGHTSGPVGHNMFSDCEGNEAAQEGIGRGSEDGEEGAGWPRRAPQLT